MTNDEKLAAILVAVQTDPGGRGLARDPNDNLFTATAGDFQAACRSLADASEPSVAVVTGFYIPTATPPAFETDGPLGAYLLRRALIALDIPCTVHGEPPIQSCVLAADAATRFAPNEVLPWRETHVVWIERAGPAADGCHYTMRGRDISAHLGQINRQLQEVSRRNADDTIGIGDGGNEIGMGKIPHDTIVNNIPNGDLIHCRVPTDHLIVCGVSNWGAYALAAGVYALRGAKPPAHLFDPDREREILEVMVREGPLVDGVTGQQTATVDGLTWDEYAAPLVRIREILEA
jgi:hypothetical protein